jgi:imidazolonepropionase
MAGLTAASPQGDLLVRRAGRIVTQVGPPIEGPAAIGIRGGVVAWAGADRDVPWALTDAPELDAEGACVLPGFVDPHTHLIWAGSRRPEFRARMAGERYDGGGIRTTVAATIAAPDAELVESAASRVRTMLANGTTTVEVKTGYGLTPVAELRLLRLAAELADRVPARIEPTLLAHVPPAGIERSDHVAALAAALPDAAVLGARWLDVFCDRGAFTVDEARHLLRAAAEVGLGGRLHAEQLTRTGAAELAAETGCASADHLEHVDAAGARAMATGGVVGVLLPTATLTTTRPAAGGSPGEVVRVLREAGVRLALGTDCNPGTSWCESMPYVIQLGCLLLGLSIDEAVAAATVGGAAALRRDDVGRLRRGARGDLAILSADHEADLVAHLGAPAVSRTVLGGVPVT